MDKSGNLSKATWLINCSIRIQIQNPEFDTRFYHWYSDKYTDSITRYTHTRAYEPLHNAWQCSRCSVNARSLHPAWEVTINLGTGRQYRRHYRGPPYIPVAKLASSLNLNRFLSMTPMLFMDFLYLSFQCHFSTSPSPPLVTPSPNARTTELHPICINFSQNLFN